MENLQEKKNTEKHHPEDQTRDLMLSKHEFATALYYMHYAFATP